MDEMYRSGFQGKVLYIIKDMYMKVSFVRIKLLKGKALQEAQPARKKAHLTATTQALNTSCSKLNKTDERESPLEA